jgi:hypothetical protein
MFKYYFNLILICMSHEIFFFVIVTPTTYFYSIFIPMLNVTYLNPLFIVLLQKDCILIVLFYIIQLMIFCAQLPVCAYCHRDASRAMHGAEPATSPVAGRPPSRGSPRLDLQTKARSS